MRPRPPLPPRGPGPLFRVLPKTVCVFVACLSRGTLGIPVHEASGPRGVRTYVRTYVRSKHRGTPNELEAALDENLASRTLAVPRTPKIGPKARPWLPPSTVWLGQPPSSSDEEPEEPEAYDLAPRPSAAPHLQPYPEGMCLQCGCVHCICDVVPQDCHRRVSVPTFVSLVFLEGCESAASSDAEAPV